jgi:signal transduction histidine kinase/signal recognition particle receptor subunit beta
MVQFDNQYKQVKLKVVYYGPALGGKTTCLQHIHRITDPQKRSKLYTLNTASDRTLFFDLLSLDLGRVRGYRVTLQLYTVPGQVQYNATRRAVLAGADGVVFVADSQVSQQKANLESLDNLGENLRANGLDPETIPVVLLLNKRDLPDPVTRAKMEKDLNRGGWSTFETVATSGRGVVESFAKIAEGAVISVADRLGLSQQTEALGKLVASVQTALRPFMPASPEQAQRLPAPAEPPVVLRPAAGEVGEAFDEEHLLGEAVRANVAMTDLNVRLDTLTRDLERRAGELRAINEFGRLMSLAREPEDVTGGIVDRLLSDLGVGAGCLLLLNGDGRLVEVLKRGLDDDPLLLPDITGNAAALTILSRRQPFLVRLDEIELDPTVGGQWVDEMQRRGLVSALALPMIAQDTSLGVVTCYADATHGPFEESDLELAGVLAANAAVALANARSWRALEQVNQGLEQVVSARTGELREALAKTEELAQQLEGRNVELEFANEKLSDLERLKGDLLSRIAHELNTPVTAIQTAARILSRYDSMPMEKVEKFVTIIADEANSLGELIASALQAVVLGQSRGRATLQSVSIQELLKKVVAPLQTEIQERRLDLKVKVAAGLDVLSCDSDQVESALRAVVRNAVEFSPAGGRVQVTVQPARRGGGRFVELRVEDAGVGISPDDLPHVAELFWQGGNVLTEKPRGLGLGLAVARRVAEGHGGALEIFSEPGKGTSVQMFLPVEAVA